MEVKEAMGKKDNYSKEFKLQAIELSNEIGTKEAAEKLGLHSPNVIGAWKRWYAGMTSSNASKAKFSKSKEDLLREISQLKKELAKERQSVSILKAAAAFFSKDHLK